MSRIDPYAKNFEEEIETLLSMTEAPGHKVFVVGIYATSDMPADAPTDAFRVGGLCRAVSQGRTRADAQFFIAGLETEIARLKKLLGER